MAHAQLPLVRRRFGETMRRDRWWVQPAIVFLLLSGFLVYSTWAAFQNAHYTYGPYLSPFYAPCLYASCLHPTFGGGLPDIHLPIIGLLSPAFLILWAPGGFRLTCYYYRGAYYKAFWADPPSCMVGEPRKSYRGERSFPLVLQNVHRYFLYLAIPFLFFLSYDVWKALWWETPAGGHELGVGVGTLVLAVNVVLLGGYTLGCHSLRHLIGGKIDRLAGRPVRFASYRCVSCLNRRHMPWAWTSLVWVAFSDVYVRLLSMGVWTDWRIF